MFLIRNVQLFCISSPPHPFVSFIPALLSHWAFFYYLPLFVTVSFTSYIFLPLLFLPLPRLTSFLSFVPPFLHHNHNASLSKVLFHYCFLSSFFNSYILATLTHPMVRSPWAAPLQLLRLTLSNHAAFLQKKTHTLFFDIFNPFIYSKHTVAYIQWIT